MALSNSLFRSFFAAKGWRVPAPGETFGVGIRGVRLLDPYTIEVVPNAPGKNNDMLGFAGADWFLAKGTVEPGNVPASNPRGMAFRADGEHLFQLGTHKGHPALVQYGPARLWRDTDADHRQDADEPTHAESGNGLNWHAGPLGEVVGGYSLGCFNTQGGWKGAAWKRTLAIAEDAIRHGRTVKPGVIAVYLIDGAEFVEWSGANG